MATSSVQSPIKKNGVIEALKVEAQAWGTLTYAQFTALALYDDKAGYYAHPRRRIGRNREADFYTAESLGPVFSRLTCAAMQSLLGNQPMKHHHFMELGAEPDSGTFAQEAGACASYQAFSHRDAISLSGGLIVFANELLDAQPFHRLVFKDNQWRELGVWVDNETLKERLLPQLSAPIMEAKLELPRCAPEGYHLDISLQAEALLRQITNQTWDGLLVLFDYGKTWRELTHACPTGTARAYRQHQCSNDLLAHPGEQDLTCDVCWDRLEAILLETGFSEVALERQETFFVNHAKAEIETLITAQPNQFDPIRQTLIELIHPHHMGSKFQVLHGMRS